MELYLMQHGACLPEEMDPDRPLSPLGREVVEKSARGVVALGIRPDLIVASTKTRALQTAAIVARAVRYPGRDIAATNAVKALARPEQLEQYLHETGGLDHIFICGHQPNIGKVVSAFAAHGASDVVKVENAGLTRLTITRVTPLAATIAWHLTAKQLAAIGAGY